MIIDPVIVTADAVDEAKTYVRIENDEEDGLIAALLASAVRHAENYTGTVLLIRGVTERIKAPCDWQRLSAGPVQSIVIVATAPPAVATLLPVDAYAIDIDGRGDGWVRIGPGGVGQRVDVTFTAGLAASWAAIPDPLRHAVLRMTAYLHANRDGDAGPPAAIAALLRPWRTVVLS